jgi:hypothetical protein
MYTHKTGGVEPFGQLLHSLAHQVQLTARMQSDVVTGCLDPVHIGSVYEGNAMADAHSETTGVYRGARLHFLERIDSRRLQMSMTQMHGLAGAIKRLRTPPTARAAPRASSSELQT